MEYRNFFENLKFINIVNFFCEDRLKAKFWAVWLAKVKAGDTHSPICLRNLVTVQ